MSAADEAWEKWRTRFGQYTIEGDDRESFMAGYRRALEDAADAVSDGGPGVSDPLEIEQLLRARAAAVAPRETKD